MFTCEIPVHFGHVDQARIVYYPHFFHFCHVAMEEMFRAVVGIAYRDVLEKDRLGFPAVHIETDFQTSIGYGETKIIEVRDFFQAIVTGKQPSPNFEDGYRISCIADAILASGESEIWVKVRA